MAENYDPRYREWSPGRYEQVLVTYWDDFNADNRLRRVERCALHIRAGADRDLCRQFIYTEDEWRSACSKAGGEPGDGWITRPGEKLEPVKIAPKKCEQAPELVSIGTLLDDIPF